MPEAPHPTAEYLSSSQRGLSPEGDAPQALPSGTGLVPSPKPHIVIVGAGFAGLACARALGNSDLDVTLIDRRNYHLFAPLLYQVATAVLSPGEIAEPVRRVMSPYRNVTVLLGEVTGVDTRGAHVAAGGADDCL